MERRLKSWKIEFNLKRNQPYLSRGLNSSRSSNSLNSASENKNLQPYDKDVQEDPENINLQKRDLDIYGGIQQT